SAANDHRASARRCTACERAAATASALEKKLQADAVIQPGIAPCDFARHEHRAPDLFLCKKLPKHGPAFVDAAGRVEERRAVGLDVDGEENGRLTHGVTIALS